MSVLFFLVEKEKRSFLRTLRIWLRNIVVFFFVSTVLAVLAVRCVPVVVTPLMVIRLVEQKTSGNPLKMERRWMPLDSISPNVIDAVIASEDNHFLQHNGFDFEAIRIAANDNRKGKRMRGGSTISQQVAKNVFLWPSRTWLRKGLECYFTLLLELFLPKERIMELYLNVVEFGDGLYGVEAASKRYFKHSSLRLSRDEAASLAATLPAPLVSNPSHPSSGYWKRKAHALKVMSLLKKTEWGLRSPKKKQ